MSDSLYNTLTTIPAGFSKDNLPAAVELIRYLLNGVAYDACTASNNVQVLCHLGSKAQDICRIILEYINDVETTPAAAFEAFKKYTVMVKPLEDALFDVVKLNTAEVALVPAELNTKEKIYEPYSKWWEDRNSLRTALGKLYDGDLAVPGVTPSETDAAKTYDDLSFLELVATRIRNNAVALEGEEDGLKTAALDVKSTYDAIHKVFRTQTGGVVEDFLNLSVRSASVLLGILTSSVPMENVKRPWRKESTWIDAKAILEKLLGSISTSQTLSEELAKEWDEFEIDLFTDDQTPEDLRALILDLLRNVANIHRGFYAQAFTLVLQCYDLEEKSRTTGRNDVKLKQIIADISAALTEALVSNRPHLSAITKEEDVPAHPAHEPLQTAIASLTGGFTDYSVTDTATTAIQAAKESDRSTIKSLIERRNDVARRPTRNVEFATISVKVSGGNDEPTDSGAIDMPCKVDKNMPIEGILWHLTRNTQSADGLKLSPRFFKKSGNDFEPLDRKLTIAELMDGAASYDLYVVVEDLDAYKTEMGI